MAPLPDLTELLDPRHVGRVLVIAAHPDDETVGFGGTLARLVRRRAARPHIVIVTDGAPLDPALRARSFQGSREAYAATRTHELIAALAEAGLDGSDVETLGIVDQTAADDLERLTRHVAERLARITPDLVVTHAYEGGHPDHDATCFAVHTALRMAGGAGGAPPLLEWPAYHGDGGDFVAQRFLTGDAGVDLLEPDDRAVKARMLACYASQSEILASFTADREPLRVASTYDFGTPPHAGPVNYERLGWPMRAAEFSARARRAEVALLTRREATKPPRLARKRRCERTIVSVSYALGRVGGDAEGGAEQILASVEEGIAVAGHTSVLVAPAGSTCRGELVATPRGDGALLDTRAKRAACRAHAEALRDVLARRDVDLVHLHGVDYHEVLPPEGVPVLVTLHLPASMYAAGPIAKGRARTWYNAVSETQRRTYGRADAISAVIPNGIALDRLGAAGSACTVNVGEHALFLGRICPEKGVEHAISAAEEAGLRLVIAGPVQPYPEHLAYHARAVAPRLGPRCQHIGPVFGAVKAELVATARVVIVPSLVPETSSLVAMEAIASGTPVAALRAGALPEIVEEGVTGAIAEAPDELTAAIERCLHLDREACRRRGRARFDARRMVASYLELYDRILRGDLAPARATTPEVRA